MLWAKILEEILQRVGGAGADVAKAQALYGKADRARQAELERRAAAGALGLTDEELGRLNEISVAPVQAQLRELNLRNAMGSSVQDIGSGQAARAAIASQDDQTRKLVQAGYGAAAANESARKAQEKELLDLQRAKQLKAAATWQALFGNLVTGKGIEDIYQAGSQAKADAELLGSATSRGASGYGADAGLASDLLRQFGGM